MEVIKQLNKYNICDIYINHEQYTLNITFSENGDPYIFLTNGNRFQQYKNYKIKIPIYQNDKELYSTTEKFYEELVSSNIDPTFVTDDSSIDAGDRISIEKEDEHYNLVFCRTELPNPRGKKNSHGLVIHMFRLGSRNTRFVNCFIKFYINIENISSFQKVRNIRKD